MSRRRGPYQMRAARFSGAKSCTTALLRSARAAMRGEESRPVLAKALHGCTDDTSRRAEDPSWAELVATGEVALALPPALPPHDEMPDSRSVLLRVASSPNRTSRFL